MWQPEAFIDTCFPARPKRSMRPRERATRRSQPITTTKVRAATCRSRVRNHDHDPLVVSRRENSKQFGLVVWKTGDVIDWSSHCSELLHVFKSNVPIDLTVPIAGDSCSDRYRVSIVRDACDYPTLLDTSTSLDLIAIQHRY